MGLAKLLAFARIIGTIFLPTKDYAQNIERSEIIFENPISKEQFFTKKFIIYLNNLENTKGQRDRFYFNGVKNGKQLITASLPLNNVFSLSRKFYLNNAEDNPLYVEFEFFGEEDGSFKTDYNVLGINEFNKKEELYSQAYELFKKGIFQRKGLKKVGIWKDAKKYYSLKK